VLARKTIIMAETFCPKCGATEGKFVKGFCQKCFLEDNEIASLPKKIEIAYCRQCNKVRVKGKMLRQSEQALKEIVLLNFKTSLLQPKTQIFLEPQDNGTTIVRVEVEGKIGNEELSLSLFSLLVPKEITCNDCNLLGANYYEAVLQLRFEKKTPTEKMESALADVERLAKQLEKDDSLSKVTGIERAYGGYNVQLGSKRAAKKIVEFFEQKKKAKTKSSFTLAGVDASGKTRKRYTFLVRL
jgi:NMD protein affecting ribosome stability and mRNA decay